MPYCSHCAAEVGSEDQSCPECGATFAEDGRSFDGPDVDVESLAPVLAAVAALSSVGLLTIDVVGETASVLSAYGPRGLALIHRPTPWMLLLFPAFWGVAAVGVWRRTDRGITAAGSVFAAAAVVGLLRFAGASFAAHVDPVSGVLALVFQIEGMWNAFRGLPLAFELLNALRLAGIGASAWIAWLLLWNRDAPAASGE